MNNITDEERKQIEKVEKYGDFLEICRERNGEWFCVTVYSNKNNNALSALYKKATR